MALALPRILSFDFDGTLVTKGEPIDPEFLDFIRQLTADDGAWVINTGRQMGELEDGLDEHQFPHFPDYAITEETELYARNHDLETWEEVGDWNAKRLDANRTLISQGRDFFDSVRDHIETKTNGSYLRLEGENMPDEIIASTQEEMDEIAEFIDAESSRADFDLVSFQRNSIYLRFTHCDFDKGQTLAELTRVLDLNSAHVFAVGDNHNDLPKLDPEVAGAIACPSNSIGLVKATVLAHGGFVASKPGPHGVREALEHFATTSKDKS